MNTKMVSVLVLGLLALSCMPQAQACNPWDADINALRHRVCVLENLVNGLLADSSDCQDQIDDLQCQINNLQTQIDELQTLIESIQNDIDTQNTLYNEMFTQINNRLTQLEENYENLTQVTVINKYYETHNYDGDIVNINNKISNLMTNITNTQITTNIREEHLNQTIVEISNLLTELEIAVSEGDQYSLDTIMVLRTEIMTKIQNLDLKHNNIEINLQTQINNMDARIDALIADQLKDMEMLDQLNTSVRSLYIIIFLLLAALTLLGGYSFYMFRKLETKPLPQ